jgi:hypothetical protein
VGKTVPCKIGSALTSAADGHSKLPVREDETIKRSQTFRASLDIARYRHATPAHEKPKRACLERDLDFMPPSNHLRAIRLWLAVVM